MSLLHEDLTHGASRLRIPTLENLLEDLKLEREGILDAASFVSGYRFHNHPIEVMVHDIHGAIKTIRRSHNLRSNIGGHDQGLNMGSTAVATAQYIGLSSTAFTPNTSDTTLNGELGGALSRVLATFAWVTDPSGVAGQLSTAQGAYKLTASWTSNTTINNLQACGVFNAVVSGDMWFEATFGAISSVNTGDTINLTYQINF